MLRKSGSLWKTLAGQTRLYSALSDENRIVILLDLSNPGEGKCFNELKRETGLPSGRLAYHLGLLKRASLIENRMERHGRKSSCYGLSGTGRTAVKKMRNEIKQLQKAHSLTGSRLKSIENDDIALHSFE